MRAPHPVALFLLFLVAGFPSRLPAQRIGSGGALSTGVEGRGLTFGGLPSARRLWQVAIPLGAAFAWGRFGVDVGTTWASTELSRPDGTSHRVSDLADTQVRGAWTFGDDALVATVVVNLPTGPSAASARDYTVIGAVSPAFLGFPVPAYASGFSVTTGLAGAVQAGSWSLGLAGSVRVSREFTPYTDVAGPITYHPGIEGRIRAGADGLVGSSRLTLGLTLSGFGTDEFGSGGAATGEYRPGRRVIVEAAALVPIGSTALSVSAWDYYRSAGDTSSVSAANRENLAGGSVSLAIPLGGGSVTLEPGVEGRLFDPESGSGRLLGAGLGVRFALGKGVEVSPAARWDTGSFTSPSGFRHDLDGWAISVFIRISW